MNFEEAFAHYKDGVATEEEKAYVKKQLEIAKAFVADDEKYQSAPVIEATDDDVKKAKKKFKWRYVVIPAISLICTLLVVAAILGGVFGSAATYAKQSMIYSKYECEAFAWEKLKDVMPTSVMPTDSSTYEVDDVDKEFNYVAHDIKKSYYSYYFTFERNDDLYPDDSEVKVVIEVNTVTGVATLVKIKNK